MGLWLTHCVTTVVSSVERTILQYYNITILQYYNILQYYDRLNVRNQNQHVILFVVRVRATFLHDSNALGDWYELYTRLL